MEIDTTRMRLVSEALERKNLLFVQIAELRVAIVRLHLRRIDSVAEGSRWVVGGESQKILPVFFASFVRSDSFPNAIGDLGL